MCVCVFASDCFGLLQATATAMSVDRSLNDSSDLSRDESIPMERLKQFVEDDLWYFSDDDSSGSSDEDISVGSSEGSLQDDVSFLPEEVKTLEYV